MEEKCLRHLDSSENWTLVLKREKPDEWEILPWTPFWRIFVINFVQFVLVFGLLFVVYEYGLTGGQGSIKEDLPIGLSAVTTLTFGFALYVTGLYRRCWNRRARSLDDEDADR